MTIEPVPDLSVNVTSSESPEVVEVRRVLEAEVPEVRYGIVRIRGIGRLAGRNTKLALDSIEAGVDPVGAVVGPGAVRISAISKRLGPEKIDLIPWSADLPKYFRLAVAPFGVTSIELDHARQEVHCDVDPVPPGFRPATYADVTELVASELTGWRFHLRVRGDGTTAPHREQ